jgi:hypothetical protein
MAEPVGSSGEQNKKLEQVGEEARGKKWSRERTDDGSICGRTQS